MLITFVVLAQQVGTNLNAIGRAVLNLQQLSAVAERIYQVLALEPDIKERPGARPLIKPRGELAFHDVTFAYNGKEPVLSHVTFSIASGERLALVGHSGAGKSTLANLVLRLYEPNSGSVTIDEVDVRDLTLDSLRRTVALVPQETVLFSGTVAENIAYGSFEAGPEQIEEAAKAAGADAFIRALPDGYDTIVGERGVTLSGGERQRVAIARALLRDPRILILDEATSSLDAQTEAAVQEALDTLMKGRTTLIIAHRLSSLRNVDRIVMLEKGRIVESVSHAELMSRRGAYYNLYQMQQRQESEEVGSDSRGAGG